MENIVIDKKEYVLATQDVLNSLDDRFVGYVLNINEVCSVLEQQLFKVFSTKDFNLDNLEFFVERVYQKEVLPNTIQATGEYVSFDIWEKHEEIDETLKIFLSSKDKLIYFSEEKWDKFKYHILQVFVHELVHVAQSRSRRGDVFVLNDTINQRTSADYFGEPDELDAFAFNGALDLIALEKTLKETDINVDWKKIIRTGVSRKLSIEFASYYNTFNQPTERKILNKFLKRVYKYVEYLQNE